jgi:tRNA pseudouridine55 synthase
MTSPKPPRIKKPIDGVLLLDKPLGITSNAALQKARHLYQAAKAGHTGTLDPLASGLLPVCFGEATKFSTGLLDADKTYRARVTMGVVSSTHDAEGEFTPIDAPLPDEARLREALAGFVGDIEQVPPMHSALKHQGKPLYEYIRRGETVEREARRVTIFSIALERFERDEFEITVHCSKGTYIRTLAFDIGQALGCGAYLSGLRRTAIGNFTIEGAHTLDELLNMPEAARAACLLPVDILLQDMSKVELDEAGVLRILQGQTIRGLGSRQSGSGQTEGPLKIRLYGAGRFLGVGEMDENRIAPVRLLSVRK